LTPEDEVVREIAAAREAAREAADAAAGAYAAPAPLVVEVVPAPEPEPAPAAQALPAPPDASSVNASWRAPEPAGGLRGVAERLLAQPLQAQQRFAADQVRLDNELLAYLAERFAATHRHYDAILAAHARRMNDIDQRHLQLQERLVVHVHELVGRIDLVLEASERSRLSAQADLRRLQARVEELERRLGRG
jgi:hypothetical protein